MVKPLFTKWGVGRVQRAKFASIINLNFYQKYHINTQVETNL